MSNPVAITVPTEIKDSKPRETNYAKVAAINTDNVAKVISTKVITNPPSSNRRRYANGASKNSTRKKQNNNDVKIPSSSPSPEALNRVKQTQSVRRSRRVRRKNKKMIDSGNVSPSVVSSCSMASIATTSSGLSSNTSSIRAINDAVEAIPCSDTGEKLSSSSAASSAGFCDMTSTDGADEDDFGEYSAWQSYFEDLTLLDQSNFLNNSTNNHQYSFPASSTKPKNKRFRNKQRHNVFQYPNLSDPKVQKFYHQQRLFYRMIYEQQFAVLNTINVANDPKSKDTKHTNGKTSKYTPHQHLGLPPLPPPPMTFTSWCYPNSQSVMDIPNFLEIQSPCETAFLENLRSHSIKRLSRKSTSANASKMNFQQTTKQPTFLIKPSNLTTNEHVGSDSIELRAEFCRQIRERALKNGQKQKKSRNLVLKKEFVVGEEDFPPISNSSSSQSFLTKTGKQGESGYQSESSPISGTEEVFKSPDIAENSPSVCSSPRDYSSIVAGCLPKLNNLHINSDNLVNTSEEKDAMKFLGISKVDYLSDSICEYYEKVAQTETTLLKKLRLRDMLYYTIASCFPVCGLYIVGSSLNGFGNEKSDMDICLVITNRELDQKTDAVQVLKAVEQLLCNMPFVKDYQLIEAKVPILRINFTGAYEGLTVDLNANNSVAIKNTHLLYYYAISDWRVRPLVAIVKEWAKRCNINDASQSSFTSYSLVLMVIHYLQCGLDEPILPSLQNAYHKRFNSKLDIRTLNLSMKLDPPVPIGNLELSLGELLIGFFKYYSSTFNYERDAISVRLGKQVERSVLVRERSSIYHWSPICIEEPFTRLNTAHSIFDVNVFKAIKDKFQEAYDILTSTYDIDLLLSVKPYQSPYNNGFTMSNSL